MRSLLTILILCPLMIFGQKIFIGDSFEDIDWSKNWDGSELSSLSTAVRSDSVALSGSHSLRFEINKSGTTNVRSEIKAGIEPTMNIERRYKFSIFIPQEWVQDSIGEIVFQLYPQPDFNLGETFNRSPPIALLIDRLQWRVDIRSASAAVNTNSNLDSSFFIPLGNLEKGKWIRWEVYVKPSYNNDGILRMWRNDTLVLDRTNRPNYYNDTKGPYAKFGLYKWDWGGVVFSSIVTKRVLYFDDISIGTVKAEHQYRNVTIGSLTHRLDMWYPANYDPLKRYPVQFFTPGAGELRTGNNTNDSLASIKYGPARAFKLGTWNGKIRVYPHKSQPIDTPCLNVHILYPTVTTDRLNFSRLTDTALKYLGADSMRMYVHGLSAGGQKIHHALAVNTEISGVPPSHFRWWAGAAVWSTPGPNSGVDILDISNYVDYGAGYVYGIGANDFALGSMIRETTLNPLRVEYPNQVSLYTFPGEAHEGWNTRYSGNWVDPLTGLNLYNKLALIDKYPKADAGTDKTLQLPLNYMNLRGVTKGWDRRVSWSQLSGPNTATINAIIGDSCTVSNLIAGTYQFILRSQNGESGMAAYDTMQLVVNAAPVDPENPTNNVVSVKPKAKRWVVTTTVQPQDTTVAQFFFSRTAQVQAGWVNVFGSPHTGVRSGTDNRTWRTIGISSVSTSRWTNFGGQSTLPFGSGEPTGTFGIFPATTLSSAWFSYNSTLTAGNPMLEISGLEQGSVKYKIQISTSRKAADVPEDERNTYYICTDEGGNETSADLNVKANTDKYIEFVNKEADSNGKIYLIVNKSTVGTSGFISAIRIIKQKP